MTPDGEMIADVDDSHQYWSEHRENEGADGAAGSVFIPTGERISRDIFLFDGREFEPAEEPKAIDQAGLEQLVRTGPTKEEIQNQAQDLTLESTIVSGAASTAIINGEFLRLGGQIAGFEIIQITPRSCTVEKEQIKVTLLME